MDMEDDTSESLSPPLLHPLQEMDSDFEETIEDPLDLNMYLHHDYDDTGLTSFADLDMIQMDNIGSIADILGPDPYQLTLSPSPFLSPTTSISVQSDVPTSNVSEQPPTVLSGWFDAPAKSIKGDKEEDLNNQEKDVGKQKEVTCQDEEDEETSNVEEQIEKEENDKTSQEPAEPVVELIKATSELRPDNIITAEFARYAVSAITDSSLQRTKQTEKKLDEAPKETKELICPPISTASRKQRKSENVSTEVLQKSPPSTSQVDMDEIASPAAFHDVPKVAKAAEEPALHVPIKEPVAKTSPMSKMRKLLQDKRFNLPKLITEEKTRAFDEDVDLNVPQGQTVQLVAWIRFHRIYQAGRIHVRFLSRRAGPVILVMRPNEIVAADTTFDIQTMQGDQNAPQILKELLVPFILPEESSRYVILLWDGVQWELLGGITLKAPKKPTPSPVKSPVAEPKSPGVCQTSPKQSIEREIAAAPVVEEQHEDVIDTLAQSTLLPIRPATNPASTEHLHSMGQKRKELEEKRNEVKQRLNIPQPKRMSGKINPNKIRHRTTSAPAPPPTEKPLTLEELLPVPTARRTILSSTSHRSSKSVSDTTYLLPEHPSILPDHLPRFDTELGSKEPTKADPKANKLNLPNLIGPQIVKDPNMSMYPAAEQLAVFCRLIKNSVDSSIGKFSDLADPPIAGTSLGHSSKQPESRSKTAPVVPPQNSFPPPPAPLTKPAGLKILKLKRIGPNLPSGISLPNIVRRIRILPPPASVAAKGGNTSHPFSRKGTEPGLIKQQRMHWSRVGVKPPVFTKTNPSAVPADTSVPKVPPAATVSSELSDQYYNQPIPVVSNDGVLLSTVTPVGLMPDLQSRFPKVQQVEENNPKTIEEVVIPELPKTASPFEMCVFPKVLTAEVSFVQSKGKETQSLKIILEAMTGQHQELCPNRASMLLPLPSIDDKWCLIALNNIPKRGFRVPGVSAFIPGDLQERVASTAIERKARVCFQLRLINKDSAFKPDFGVYGTPQLPRHVFIGPFPSSYVENCSSQPCMKLITLTKPATTDSGFSNNSSFLGNLCMKSSEPTASVTLPTEHVQKIVQPEAVPVDKSNEEDKKSNENYCAVSNSDSLDDLTSSLNLATPMTKLGSYSSRISSIQRQLRIRKREQERRGLLAKRLRDLDALLNSNGDVRPKAVVLTEAKAEITHLKKQAKKLEDNYKVLKDKRAELLTEKEKRLNALPDKTSPIRSYLMELL